MDSSFWFGTITKTWDSPLHATYLGVSGYNFKKNIDFLSEDLFYFNKQCWPWWNAA